MGYDSPTSLLKMWAKVFHGFPIKRKQSIPLGNIHSFSYTYIPHEINSVLLHIQCFDINDMDHQIMILCSFELFFPKKTE